MTTVLLSCAIVLSWGSWIPIAQAVPGVPQATRTLYVTAGNLVFAAAALVLGGQAGRLGLGWREFWLPLAGGLVWTAGSVCAFRASETIGLARASGTWTPLNIIVAFVFGALLFRELDGFSTARYAALAGCLVLVLAGVFLIVGSQNVGARDVAAHDTQEAQDAEDAHARIPVHAHTRDAQEDAVPRSSSRGGFLLALGAGILWGGYFVPAQWANVPSQLANFPLAVGMFVAAVLLARRERVPVRLPVRHGAVQFAAGLLFGVGSVALLGLVSRVGTGTGFTIAQLSLLVNAGVGIWVFRVPPPGSRAAKVASAGILLAGIGGTVIGAMK
jgi:glucose uptake protein